MRRKEKEKRTHDTFMLGTPVQLTLTVRKTDILAVSLSWIDWMPRCADVECDSETVRRLKFFSFLCLILYYY